MEKKIVLVDAEQLHQQDPKSDRPPQDSMDKLKVGDAAYVETDPDREGLWIRILNMDGDKASGTIDHRTDKDDKHGLKFGDTVELEKKNVFGISTKNIY